MSMRKNENGFGFHWVEDVDESEVRQGVRLLEEAQAQRLTWEGEDTDTDVHPDKWLPAQRGYLVGQFNRMSADERLVVLTIVRKLMGEGRKEHGPMDLYRDRRDLERESIDEVADGLTYVLMRMVQQQVRG